MLASMRLAARNGLRCYAAKTPDGAGIEMSGREAEDALRPLAPKERRELKARQREEFEQRQKEES